MPQSERYWLDFTLNWTAQCITVGKPKLPTSRKRMLKRMRHSWPGDGTFERWINRSTSWWSCFSLLFTLNRHKWTEINLPKACSKQLDSPSVIGFTMRKPHCSGQVANECSTGHTFPLKGCRQVLYCKCLQGSSSKAQCVTKLLLSTYS